MSALDPRRVEELFCELAELPAPARDARLRALAAGDLALALEVKSLLAADAASQGFLSDTTVLRGLAQQAVGALDGPGAFAPSADDDASEVIEPGAVVGAWRLLGVIGRGGMGRVWRAARIVGGFEQRAAIKVVRRGMARDDLLERFARERQTLAQLEHPYIARLLDGGVTPDGRPYLAMELVEGVRIDDWCRRPGVTLADRVELFCKVCRAVEHAHQRLVIHRDLKPANILVNAEGDPKLLDFGIAKVLAPDVAELAQTVEVHRLFTPDYASPEQFSGAPVTTASDVYSLGLLLYELLAGERPFDLRDKRLTEVVRLVCETAPVRPSERPGLAPALRRRLRGDLDAIVMQALRKEPERRYPSAGALREDLERHRRLEPVRAAPETARYVVGRFVRRHRFEVVAAALAVGALAVGLVVSLRQTALARSLAGDLQHQLGQRDEAVRFLADSIGAGDLRMSKGPHTTLAEILDAASTRLMDKRRFEPEVEQRLRAALALAWMACNEDRRAVGELDRELDLLAAMGAGEEDPRVMRARRRRLGLSIGMAGQEERAGLLAGLEQVVERIAAVEGPGSRHALDARCDFCVLLMRYGDGRRAAAIAREMLPAIEARWHDGHRSDWLSVLGVSNLAAALYSAGDCATAEPLARVGLERAELSLGPTHGYTLDALHTLAAIVSELGKLDEAKGLFERLVEQRKALYGERDADTLAAMSDLAIVLARQGDQASALATLLEISRLQRDEAGRPTFDGTITLANAVNAARKLGEIEQALDLLGEFLDAAQHQFDPGSVQAAYRGLIAGTTMLEAGRLDEAQPWLEESIRLFARHMGEEHEQTRLARDSLRKLEQARAEAADG